MVVTVVSPECVIGNKNNPSLTENVHEAQLEWAIFFQDAIVFWMAILVLVKRSAGTPAQGMVSLSHGSKIQILDLRSGPSGLSKESETGWNGRFVVEATNIDPHSQFFPTVYFDKMLQHVYQRHTVQRIIWLWLIRHRILRQFIKYHVPKST